MPPLPSVSGIRVVRALERHDFKMARINGSHYIMRHPDGRGTTVPVHGNRDIAERHTAGHPEGRRHDHRPTRSVGTKSRERPGPTDDTRQSRMCPGIAAIG